MLSFFLVGGLSLTQIAGAQEEAPSSVIGTIELEGSPEHGNVTVQIGQQTVTTTQAGLYTFSDVATGIRPRRSAQSGALRLPLAW